MSGMKGPEQMDIGQIKTGEHDQRRNGVVV